jgi:type IV pilus assembly protein PilC
MFQARIPLKPLSMLCRSLGTLLHSGVAIDRAIETCARKIGGPRCREAIQDAATALKRGSDVAEAFSERPGYFPPLFIDMIVVAESSGTLPEVLAGLAEHYENLLQLRRNFVSAIAWPVIQLIMAVLIIAAMIAILGIIGTGAGGAPIDVLGWGLTGPKGALAFLACVGMTALGLAAVYLILTRVLGQQRALHALFLKIPVLGDCLRSFAIARFSWAFYLTQQAGMRINPSLAASLRATSNGAFAGAIPEVCARIEAGDDLTTALTATQLFTEDFLQMVQVGETSGTVPEMLERLSPQFEDQARRSLAALAAALGWLVWLIVAGFIIFIIFRVFSWYMGLLNDALKGI